MKSQHWLLLLTVLGGVSFATVAVVGAETKSIPKEAAPRLEPLYAAPVERLATHVLEQGETLGTVLSRAGVSGGKRRSVLLAVREHFNPRRLQPDVEVTVRRWVSDETVRAIDVRLNADSTLRVQRNPVGWEGDIQVTPTTTDTVFASGIIEQSQSLYETVIEDDKVPARDRIALATELAEVYAFKLDFFHDIQPGDAYRLVYERDTRPDGTARDRRILAAQILNRGETHPAVYFDRGGNRDGYYGPDGESLRRAFRRYPLDVPRITSSFSWRRYHPILGRYRAHLGTDFGARHGTPVRSTGDGTVRFAGRKGGYGNFLELRHPGGYTTRYAHLSRFASGIRSGRRVAQGEIIAYVGASGLATGPHLHYEFRKHGSPLNPRTAKLPGAPPIPDETRETFSRIAEERMTLLRQAPLPGAGFARIAAGADEVEGDGG